MKIIFFITSVDTPSSIQYAETAKEIPEIIVDVKIEPDFRRDEKKYAKSENHQTHPKIKDGAHLDIALFPLVWFFNSHLRSNYNGMGKLLKYG